MTTWQAIDAESLRRLVTALRDTRWSWSVSEVPGLVQRMGWEMVETVEGKGAFALAGWTSRADDVEFEFSGDQVNQLTMRLTDRAPDRVPGAQAFLADAFADTVTVGAELLGPPTARTLGDRPQARWRGADATIMVRRLGGGVSMFWASNAFQDYWDGLRGEAS